ncbi:hypothetical protein PFICI_11722 [Pestalotiopsis fici W106-1]|uniref:Uncharacterized protein n=1 Tax=Pestalotiopsis fici (strain W106-1 / CGMCC3.15140) TaxID=1229662 RepID=W3WR43_PESFW|nr:uncharacterized protein PFICI_11722 [Pestalotiopsis fici W106-1]ETS76335.1 hypothetical protein PFICI_11722 [Pestalotiopsis fici W106-1]
MLLLGHANVASLLLLSATTSSVLGAPVNEVDLAHSSLVPRRTRDVDDLSKLDEICGHDINKESLKDIWEMTRVGGFLDIIVNGTSIGAYPNWVQNLDKATWDKQQSDAWDCTSFPGKCGPAADCKEFFLIRDRPQEYWIFKSIDGAHKVMNRLHEELQNDANVVQFDLDGIISDFQGGIKDLTDIYGKMAAAFTIGAGAVSVVPGPGKLASAAFNVVAGVFSLAALDKPPDSKPTAQEYLKNYFEQSQNALKDTARNLFGTGDQKKLPNLSNPHHWLTEVAQFFDDGKFLIENVDEATDTTVKTARIHLRQAIGMSVLDSQGWKLFIDPGIKDEARCKKDGSSHIWRSESNECWGLLKWEKIPSGDPFSKDRIKVTQLPEKTVQKMTKDYEMDLKTVYDNAVACKLAHPDGSARAIKVQELSPDGSNLPQCFFSIDVAKGTFTANEYKPQDLWGKW